MNRLKWSPKFQELSGDFRKTIWPWFTWYSRGIWPYWMEISRDERISNMRDVYEMYCAGGEL